MISNQPNPQETKVNAKKPNSTRNTWIIVSSVLLVAIIGCLIYFSGLANKQQASSTAPANPASSTPSTPPAAAVTPPSTPPPSTTPAPVAPVPAALPAPQPPPATKTPIATIPVSSGMISKQAYQMVLTISDMGTGWVAASAASAPKAKALSTSQVNFSGGSAFAPVVQNTVTVYRTVDAAVVAFNAEKAALTGTATVSNPGIGDECVLNDTVLTNKRLVFIMSNVVASIQIQQDKTSDPVSYARIVEQKITQ